MLNDEKNQPTLAPSSALVAIGLLTGVFQVISVVVNRNQTVQIILTASLEKAEEKPFEEIVNAIAGRL